MDNNNEKVEQRKDRSGMFFWVFAIFALFFNLGYSGLWASEDRWAEIVREMLLNADFFHPAINGEVYFDKPLLTYWLIVGVYYLFGCLSEFVIRAPSALAALAGLYGTVVLGKKLWNRETGMIAGWLLLSSYGFLFWGRLAAADMANLSAIILAVAWFFHCEKNAGFFSYLLFYLICFLGAMTKGLPALVMPVAAIAPYLLLEQRWKKHLTFANFAAAIIGLGVYLLPFYLAAVIPLPECYQKPIHNLSGLDLVWQENILRVFKPFDHDDEPFFCYLYQLPRVMLPWSLLLLAAVAKMISNWKKLKPETRWLGIASLTIFLLFSASGSRRWYYILPLMPFCSLQIAIFLLSENKMYWEKILLEIMRWLLIIIASAAVISIVMIPFWSRLLGFLPPLLILISAPVSGAIALCIMFIDECLPRRRLYEISGIPESYAGIVLSGAIMVCCFFSVIWPALDTFRTEKPFALKMKGKLASMPEAKLIFFKKAAPKLIFYMDLQRPVPVIDDVDELKLLLEDSSERVVLVSHNRSGYLRELEAILPGERILSPDFAESYAPLERKQARKLYVWFINGGEKKYE